MLLCRWLLAISLQANAVLEEILGWRVSYLRSDSMYSNDTSKLELLRPPTRFSILSEQNILKLANSNICPVAAWRVLDARGALNRGESPPILYIPTTCVDFEYG